MSGDQSVLSESVSCQHLECLVALSPHLQLGGKTIFAHFGAVTGWCWNMMSFQSLQHKRFHDSVTGVELLGRAPLGQELLLVLFSGIF